MEDVLDRCSGWNVSVCFPNQTQSSHSISFEEWKTYFGNLFDVDIVGKTVRMILIRISTDDELMIYNKILNQVSFFKYKYFKEVNILCH